MIAFPSHRFILTGLVLAMIAGAAVLAIGNREPAMRAWVAGHAVPCVSLDTGSCGAGTANGQGAN